jgi:hypothetical protein
MCLQFGFVIFWRKDFGAKAAHKTLVKLTPDLPKLVATALGLTKFVSIFDLNGCISLEKGEIFKY